MSERTLVHLLRHGEVHNPDKVLYGRLDGFHLSERGRAMAQVVADHLHGRDITHLVSSPLIRAQETMAPLAERLGLPVTLDERVLEATNRFEGQQVSLANLLRPKNLAKMHNITKPSWGEPYVEIVEPERLVFTFKWDESHEDGPPVDTLVTVQLDETDDGRTVMNFTHASLKSQQSLIGHRHGWTSTVDRLEAWLAANPD